MDNRTEEERDRRRLTADPVQLRSADKTFVGYVSLSDAQASVREGQSKVFNHVVIQLLK